MGQSLIAEGWPSFVALLAREVPDDPDVLIVDGVRHVRARDALQVQFPSRRTVLVFLESDDRQRQARLALRGEGAGSLAHPIERELAAVYSIADLILSANKTTAQQVQCIAKWIETRNGHGYDA
jgi:hypothetical protein